jgi:TonB family protein
MRTRYVLSACVVLLMAGVVGRTHAQTDATVFDESMQSLSFADMTYPPIAGAARVQGAVVVAVTLDDEGGVTAASAISGAKLLIPDSLANARKWTFKPNAQKRAVIVYDFTIEGACHNGAQSLFRMTHFNQATISTCAVVLR